MKPPEQFIILQERAAGNVSVGTAWTDARTFPPTATLAEVWEWARVLGADDGRTMIRPDLAAPIKSSKT